MNKVTCTECDFQGTDEMLLVASNPFDKDQEISGCPKCKSIETILVACDEPGCWKVASCGTPTEDGYRTTCGKHKP